MRTTVTIDDDLLAKAKSYSGIEETPALIRHALAELVQNEVARRLIALGGSDPGAEAPPRRWADGDSGKDARAGRSREDGE